MVKVRPCSSNDLQSVFEIAEKYTSFDATPTFADIEGMYSRNPDYFFVAEDNSGRVTGFITGYERKGLPENVLRTWNAKRVGYVELMAVDSRYRRKGIGRALMNTLLEHFQRNGIDIVNLDVPAEQEAAVQLYKKLGFYVRACNTSRLYRTLFQCQSANTSIPGSTRRLGTSWSSPTWKPWRFSRNKPSRKRRFQRKRSLGGCERVQVQVSSKASN